MAVRGGARARASEPPGADEVLAELDWVIAGASEHLGVERAGRYLRRFYPWYVERLGAAARRGARAQHARCRRPSPSRAVRELLDEALAAQPV